MLNGIFIFLVLSSILLAAWNHQMEALTGGLVESAGSAVKLAIGLVGMMAFFLGLMRVMERAGMLRRIAWLVGPIMRRLFPSVPTDHPAMSAMIMNIAANMLGLVNAATPFGIKAMEELDTLNGEKGTATNAMALFLAINTSAVAILPSGAIALRASLGSADPAGIFLTTWFASGCATVMAIAVALLLSRLPRYRQTEPQVVTEPVRGSDVQAAGGADDAAEETELPTASMPRVVAAVVFGVAVLILMVRDAGLRMQVEKDAGTAAAEAVGAVARGIASWWALPVVVALLVLLGWVFRVRVYEALVEGAKDGFNVALRIIPFLVAILVAVGMFRASGGIDLIVDWLSPVTSLIGMPAEALPLAILRPLSGSGAYGLSAQIMEANGPDSVIGYMVSTMQGSTETTFYVLAVYFGAVGVRRTRHTLPACLAADVTGLLAAVFIVNLMFG